MLNVDDYGRIRRAKRDGLSIRAICQLLGHSHHTVRKALTQAEPDPYRRAQPPGPKLGALHAVIEQILLDDEDAPRKQRHTMAQVFHRLVEEHGYSGGYDAVRRHIRKRRDGPPPDTCLPLVHQPGHRLECDFGQVWVDLAGQRQQVSVLVCTWSYSNAPFAIALPTQRLEAVLAGMVAAFEFFGCVPREVWWDNPRTVVTHIGPGRERIFHERFRCLASWYCFEPCACMAHAPQEKPRVENRVKDLQRRWATPVPRIRDLAHFNERLRARCLKERQRCITGQSQTIGERFAAEVAVAYALPSSAFLAATYREACVDGYQCVRLANVQYSVPHRQAFGRLTIRSTIDRVDVLRGDEVVASHVRCYQAGSQVLDPLHYLPTLHRKPNYLDQTEVYGAWQLPPVFDQLREALTQIHGQRHGQRQYIGVLQLLLTHPLEAVGLVVGHHLARGLASLDTGAIRLELERLTPRAPAAAATWQQVQVPVPDLRLFDQLLTPGGTHHA